jgi:hypothetical protein
MKALENFRRCSGMLHSWGFVSSMSRDKRGILAGQADAALAEELRGAALRGRGTGADDLVRVERLSAYAVRALRLPSMASKPTPTLGDLLRADHERQMERVP